MSRILIAEDEPVIARGLEDDLRMEGYDVEVVDDGAVASRRAMEGQFDLILLDIMLPNRDGFDICRDVRKAGLRTPIIMLTARAQEVEKVFAFELGADDYVTKPFGIKELRARVKALLRRADPRVSNEPEPFRFDDVEVDFTRGEVRRAGRPVEITSTEFKLLVAFVRNRGRIMTRQQLLDAAWGPGVILSDRAIDNHIVHLRRKIEAKPTSPKHVLSIRGLGYRFDA